MINRSLQALALTAALLTPAITTATASAHTTPRTLPAVLGHPVTHTVQVNRHRLPALTHSDARHTISAGLLCPC